jgi:hypothetical protein
MKEKNVFEASGNSPTATARVKFSAEGAAIQTGRGLEDTKRRIMEAFERIRQHPVQHSEPTPQPQVELVYTEQHKTRFHERAKRLSLAALSSSHIMKATRSPVFEIAVPTESAEELIREALGE